MSDTLLHSTDVDLIAALEKSGWYAGRRVDITHWTDFYRRAGKEPFAAATAVLEEFGGLYVEPPVSVPGRMVTGDDFNFVPVPAFNPSLYQECEEQFFNNLPRVIGPWERHLGRQVYILGYYYVYPILIDETGAVYLDCEWGIRYGDDITAALEYMILHRDFAPIFALPGQEALAEESRRYQSKWRERIAARRRDEEGVSSAA